MYSRYVVWIRILGYNILFTHYIRRIIQVLKQTNMQTVLSVCNMCPHYVSTAEVCQSMRQACQSMETNTDSWHPEAVSNDGRNVRSRGVL